MNLRIDKSLVKGSLILLVSFNIFNVVNFIFHFCMARMLSIADYGVLVTLFSILFTLAIFTESIQMVISKYAANEKNKGRLKNLIIRGHRKSFFASLTLFLIYLLVAIPFSYILKIEYFLMALGGTIMFATFLTPINRGIMQEDKRFKSLGLNMVVESITKLALALIFVYIGWRVYGAVLGTVLGSLVAFLLSFFSIRDILKSTEKNINTEKIKEMYCYIKPVFIVNLAILLFYSLDVVIARIFFSEVIAGSYAIASILAKTLFLGTQPISRAMFPLSVKNNSNKKKSENIFGNALVILMIIIFFVIALFYFFPEFIVGIFSGKFIPESIGILFYLGIAIGLFSLANLILFYRLSLGKIKGHMYLFLFVVIELLLLSYFSDNIFQFSVAFITASAIFLWGVIFLVKNE